LRIGTEPCRQILDRLNAIEARLARFGGPAPDLSDLELDLTDNIDRLNAMKERISTIDAGLALTGHEASVDVGSDASAEPANSRVSRLERDIVKHQEALSDLERWSLQAEQSMRQLLQGIKAALPKNQAVPDSR
jgi:hypothetical protein